MSPSRFANLLVGSLRYGPPRPWIPRGTRLRGRTISRFQGERDHMEESIFQPYLGTRTIFKMDREILRPSYIPERLPHRESHIDQLAQILVTALKGERPSNVLIFGKTGSGKTAVVKYIENEFRKADGARMVQYFYLNCEIVDTPYGVLQSIGNKLIENFHQRIPFTGLSTDRVYNLLREKLDEEKRVVIVALDEIDKIVQKNGDDILSQRARLAFENGTAEDGVLHLIAALAAQEHGDARRALDLLRVSAELAERQGDEHITEEHVQRAKNKIELDTVIEAVKSLPTQSKVILLGILLNEEIGNPKLTTGEVYTTYRELCRKTGIVPLTQRRVTDLISELDMLGLVHARVRSFGRGGRTKEIQGSVPPLDVKKVLEKDEILAEARGYRLKVQTTLL